MERNSDNIWEMVSDSCERPQSNGNKIIFLLSELLQTTPEFIGTPTELSNKIDPAGTAGITPKKVTRQILQSVEALSKIGITATTRRSSRKRIIELHSADSVDLPGPQNIGTIDPVEVIAPCPPA